MGENGLNAADVMALTNDGFGGNTWAILILFILIFGMGGFGINRNGELNQYATAASQQEILFGQQFQNLNSSINKVGDGIASLGYNQLGQMNAMQTALGGAIVGEGRALQTQIADFKYDNAMQAADIKTAVHAEGEATRAMIQQDKIASLTAEVNELKTQNMFCGIPRINPYGYSVVPNCGCNAL